MRFDSTADYDAPADAVFAIMSQTAFQDEKVAVTSDLGGPTQVTQRGDRTVIRTERAYSSSVLPEVARRFVGERFTIVEEQNWGPANEAGDRTGRLEMHISGQLLTLVADLALRTTATGSHTSVSGELKARIPLIGGKIESAAAPLIKDGVQAEATQIRRWLAR